MAFDLAIIETGNGGDIKIEGQDVAVVRSIENMPYLAMFGGNVEESTTTKIYVAQSFDWWANNLLMLANTAIQMNSTVERTLNTTPLTSAGRVLIENAIKKDLEFFQAEGATVEVTVEIVSTDRINVTLKITQSGSQEKIRVINFKKQSDGDWFILDFNNDFYL